MTAIGEQLAVRGFGDFSFDFLLLTGSGGGGENLLPTCVLCHVSRSNTRLQATSPTYGAVTLVIVDEPGQDRFYLLCLSTSLTAPQLLCRWRHRHWIEYCFRTLKHLLHGACQVHSEDAYYGHLVLRLMACFVFLHLASYL